MLIIVVIEKVLAPMQASRLFGFVIAYTVIALLYVCLERAEPMVAKIIFVAIRVSIAANTAFMYETEEAHGSMQPSCCLYRC